MITKKNIRNLAVAMLAAFSIPEGQAQNPTDTFPNATTDNTISVTPEKKRVTRTRSYTEKNPLVYEDMWDLWPYAFQNNEGEPDGFNVELIRMVLDELDIPYVIKLKDQQEAFEDLRDGKSDLMLGLSAGFHDAYGLYSENPITLFTQSVASPIDKPVDIRTFKDLGNHKVIVNDSSLCHHLMIDYGWADNAIPYSDMKSALQEVSTEGEGMIVWNTLSLKWLINKYHIENLQIIPVNMPHGEYKFMSNDPVLLQRLDSIYSVLDSSDKLVKLRNKWFYPERQDTGIPSWIWWVAGAATLLALIMGIYAVIYNIQGKRLTRRNDRSNKRLALIMETSHVRIWTYEVATRTFTWRNENGQAAYTYTAEEFAHRYHPEDFQRLTNALQLLAEKPPVKSKEEEEEITLNIKAKDTEDGDAEERDFIIVLSVLRRDKRGNATFILGTKKDVTEQTLHQRQEEDSIQRYWAIFNMPMMGVIYFTHDGDMININEKACQMFRCNHDDILAQHPSYKDFLQLDEVDIDNANNLTTTKTYPEKGLSVNLKFLPVDSGNVDEKNLLVVCHDITTWQEKIKEKGLLAEEVKAANEELRLYFARIDALLHDGNIRMANYSPDSHTLTIFNGTQTVQHALTQTRCMTLVDEKVQKKAMHIISDMDSRTDKKMRFDIRTTLYVHGDYPLHLLFSFIPIHGSEGEVTEYFGLCQDITLQKSTDYKLLQEANKVQEVENTKTSFINNMVQEIRTPMDTIVKTAEDLCPQLESGKNCSHCDVILQHSTYLLHLIDNILYLSRLEAHMIEIDEKPIDFVDTFTTYCVPGRLNNSNVTFTTESPYDQLVVNIDAQKIGNVIERVVENAIQHTRNGFIRARYDYIGRQLMISIEDTGDGIPQRELEQLNAQTANDARTSSGLGIPICKELLAQMGGHLEINSEEGLGTTVWIIIPCQATTIKRKKMV